MSCVVHGWAFGMWLPVYARIPFPSFLGICPALTVEDLHLAQNMKCHGQSCYFLSQNS